MLKRNFTYFAPLQRSKVFLVTIGLALMGGASVGAAEISAGWSDRGVFVFGSYVLDFKLGYLKTPRRTVPLEDCGNEAYFCASSSPFNIVLPRTCRPIEQGDRWTVNGVTTEVLRKEVGVPQEVMGPVPLPAERRTLYLLTTPGSDVVFRYDPLFGIETMWLVDSFSGHDFVGTARKMGILGLKEIEKSGRYYPLHLITFDAFGKCLPPT